MHAQNWEVKEDFQLKFTHLTKKNGLSNNRILNIMQDRSGFIWIATENGLNRYDGYDFVIFKNSPTDSSTISSNMITCITEDTEGNLWIGTVFGLNKYDRSSDRFIQFFANRNDKYSLKNNHIRALLADDNGILWIETMGGILHKLNTRNHEMKYYYHSIVTQGYYHYHDIIKENDSTLWLGGRNMDVHRFHINSGKFDVFKSSRKDEAGTKKTNDVSSYFIDSKKQLWITALDGAYILNPETAYFQKFLKGSCFSILEEKNGIMWFGTGNGIYRYNSELKQMTHMGHLDNNPHSLSNNNVNKMIEDQSGVIWIATNNGLDQYSPKKSNFKHFFHIPGQENTISGTSITALVQDKDENLWIGTAAYGINKLDLKTGKIKKYVNQSGNNNSLISNHISQLYFNSQEQLYIATWEGKGFQQLDIKNNHFLTYTIDSLTTNIDWYNGFCEDSLGNINIAVWGGVGLYTLVKKSKEIKAMGKYLNVSPNGIDISALGSDSDSILWLGGTKGIVNAYLYREREFIHFSSKPSANSYGDMQKMQKYGFYSAKLPSFNRILKHIKYQNKSFFLSDSGLIIYNNQERKFLQSQNASIKNEIIDDFAKGNNHLYFLDKNSVWVLGSLKNKYQKLTLSKSLLPNKRHNILVNSGNIWISEGEDLLKYNLQGEYLSSISFNSAILLIKKGVAQDIYLSFNKELIIMNKGGVQNRIALPESIKDFVIDGEMVYWIGEKQLYKTDVILGKTTALIIKTRPRLNLSQLSFNKLIKNGSIIYLGAKKGLFSFNLSNKTLYINRSEEGSFMSYPVHLLNCIEKGQQKDVWLGTTSTGLARWYPNNNTIVNYLSNEFDSSAFWGKDVNFIFTDSQKNIWIGGEGLNLYHPETNSFSHYTVKNGLASNQVRGMVEDMKGRLWIATKNGLSCFSKPEQNFSNYFEAQGLPTNELTGAAVTLKSGDLAFGTQRGLVIFHPDSLQVNTFIPPVVITEIQIQDNQLFRDLSQIDSIIIEPSENHISFRFAALDYNSPKDNQYQYKLDGLDKDWTLSKSDNRNITYSNLSPGYYQFKLRGSNNNSIWNTQGKELSIHILPHYYQTWWFYGLLTTFVIFIIWMIVLYRVREIRLQHKAAELEQRFLRSQMNPHFIFNSLGAIQSFIFKNEPLEAATYLSNFSELVRLILDNSRQDLIALETEIKTLNHYLDLQLLRFGEKFNYKLEVDEELKNTNLLIPPMLAQPFIENSIEHAFAGMKEKGLLKISFMEEKNYLKLVCEDNGIGIEASLRTKKEKIKKHQSLATKITRERIKVLNKVYPLKIILEIQDLKKLNPKEKGTRIVFTIPKNLKQK